MSSSHILPPFLKPCLPEKDKKTPPLLSSKGTPGNHITGTPRSLEVPPQISFKTNRSLQCHAMRNTQPTNMICRICVKEDSGLISTKKTFMQNDQNPCTQSYIMVSSYDMFTLYDEATKMQDFQRRNPSLLGKACRHCLRTSRFIQLEVGITMILFVLYLLQTLHAQKLRTDARNVFFELEKQISVSKPMFDPKIIKDHRPKWSAKRKVAASERLHWHREATSPTSKWESSCRSLRPFATSAPGVSMKFVYETGGLWFFSSKTIFYNWFFFFCILLSSNTTNTRLQTSICFYPLPRFAVNSFFLLTGTTSIPLGQISFYRYYAYYVYM